MQVELRRRNGLEQSQDGGPAVRRLFPAGV